MKSRESFNTAHDLIIERPLNWGDMDAFQHLNNTLYFRYFESVRIAHFDQLGIMAWMKENAVGPILAHTEARFRVPLHYPDTVLIGSRIVDLETDRFSMNYGVWSEQRECLAAQGSGLLVFYDYAKASKCPVPEPIRQRILASD